MKKKNIVIALLLLIFLALFLIFGIVSVEYEGKVYRLLKNMPISKIKIPIKEGYKFLYWECNGNKLIDNYKITESISVNPVFEKINEDKKYIIKQEKIDEYTPDRYLYVYENNNLIEIKGIMYNDFVDIVSTINGSKITVSNADLIGEKSFKIVLTNGDIVSAIMEE